MCIRDSAYFLPALLPCCIINRQSSHLVPAALYTACRCSSLRHITFSHQPHSQPLNHCSTSHNTTLLTSNRANMRSNVSYAAAGVALVATAAAQYPSCLVRSHLDPIDRALTNFRSRTAASPVMPRPSSAANVPMESTH